jgi:uncharacterized membrane-anchored protein
MNLRPTKFKVIASIVISLLLWIILALFKSISLKSNFLMKFVNMHNFSNLFSLGNIALFIIEAIVVYLIISVFHKKLY